MSRLSGKLSRLLTRGHGGGAGAGPMGAMRWKVLGQRPGRETLHYTLLDMRWAFLLVLLLCAYLAAATVFFGLYVGLVSAGVGTIYDTQGDESGDGGMPLVEAAWRLSITALITLGYADVFPSSTALQALVTLQQLLGLLMSAYLISTVVHKASLPVSKLMFSRNAALLTRNGAPHLVFRLANARGNFLLAPEVRVFYFRRLATSEGEVTFVGQPLRYESPPLMAPVGAVAHTIDSDSPLHGKTLEDIRAEHGHILICVTAIDNHYLLTTFSRHVYFAGDLVEGRRFADACINQGGKQCLDLDSLSRLLPLEAPPDEEAGGGAAAAKQAATSHQLSAGGSSGKLSLGHNGQASAAAGASRQASAVLDDLEAAPSRQASGPRLRQAEALSNQVFRSVSRCD